VRSLRTSSQVGQDFLARLEEEPSLSIEQRYS
jgi:hypothetical protein